MKPEIRAAADKELPRTTRGSMPATLGRKAGAGDWRVPALSQHQPEGEAVEQAVAFAAEDPSIPARIRLTRRETVARGQYSRVDDKVDPVCGMEGEPASAAATADVGSTTYYFFLLLLDRLRGPLPGRAGVSRRPGGPRM